MGEPTIADWLEAQLELDLKLGMTNAEIVRNQINMLLDKIEFPDPVHELSVRAAIRAVQITPHDDRAVARAFYALDCDD